MGPRLPRFIHVRPSPVTAVLFSPAEHAIRSPTDRYLQRGAEHGFQQKNSPLLLLPKRKPRGRFMPCLFLRHSAAPGFDSLGSDSGRGMGRGGNRKRKERKQEDRIRILSAGYTGGLHRPAQKRIDPIRILRRQIQRTTVDSSLRRDGRRGFARCFCGWDASFGNTSKSTGKASAGQESFLVFPGRGWYNRPDKSKFRLETKNPPA